MYFSVKQKEICRMEFIKAFTAGNLYILPEKHIIHIECMKISVIGKSDL